MITGGNSIGYELKEEFATIFQDRVEEVPQHSRDLVQRRLEQHHELVDNSLDSGEEFDYMSNVHDFPVMSRAEIDIQFYVVEEVSSFKDGYKVAYGPIEDADSESLRSKMDGQLDLTEFDLLE